MKKRILVIDDDRSVRDSLKKVLAETGYEVRLEADGRDGAARLHQQEFDLLLLDLNLPNLSGFDILDLISERRPLLPVIILTGLADQCVPGSLAGAAALVEKPPDVLLLLTIIENLLARPMQGLLPDLCENPLAGGTIPPTDGKSRRQSGLPRQSARFPCLRNPV